MEIFGASWFGKRTIFMIFFDQCINLLFSTFGWRTSVFETIICLKEDLYTYHTILMIEGKDGVFGRWKRCSRSTKAVWSDEADFIGRPSPADLRRTVELEKFLGEAGLYGSREEAIQKEQVLRLLDQIEQDTYRMMLQCLKKCFIVSSPI